MCALDLSCIVHLILKASTDYYINTSSRPKVWYNCLKIAVTFFSAETFYETPGNCWPAYEQNPQYVQLRLMF